MYLLLTSSILILWLVVLFLSFLLLGALRSLGLVHWRLDQLEMTRPSRIGRDGLKPGKRAPDFTLPSVSGGDVSLHDFVGRRLLLVFTQSDCGPCHDIVPELNRLHDKGECQVLVINNADVESRRVWAAETQARFPVLVHEKFSVSKRYGAFATPFAFLIDEQGVVRSKGIAGSRQYLGYVLAVAGQYKQQPELPSDGDEPQWGELVEDGSKTARSESSLQETRSTLEHMRESVG